MKFRRRFAATVAIVFGLTSQSVFLSDLAGGVPGLATPAHAQSIIRNLIARLRGETLPAGIVKSNGRIEATQVDVSSKYAGRLDEVTVEEGSTVAQGQVIARISAPEYEAQLRAAQAAVQSANDALAAAEAEITSRQSALEFAKSDFERGQELMKTGFITKQVFEQRKRNYDFGGRRRAELHVAARPGPVEDQKFGSGSRADRGDHQGHDARFATQRTRAVPARPGRRSGGGGRADRHHPRSHRRLHDDLSAGGRCGQGDGRR